MARFYMTTHTTLSATYPEARRAQPGPSALIIRHSPALRRLNRDEGSLISTFLIANARLEFPATPTKQSIDIKSNRKWIAIFSRAPRRFLFLESACLIYGGAIRTPRKVLKT
jgi:hypothetical protein